MLCDVTGKLVINYQAKGWCKLPYPGHPKGCSNWDKNKRCPPKTPRIEDTFDLSQPHFFQMVRFDLATHMQNMKAKHPDWSDRQAKCVLYWQNGVRKQLLEDAKKTLKVLHYCVAEFTPEALGVDVFSTLDAVGIQYERNPINFVLKVALIGRKL